MAGTQYTGPRMPRDMNALINGDSQGKKRKHVQSRIERRKFERQQKKSVRTPQRSKSFQPRTNGPSQAAVKAGQVLKGRPSKSSPKQMPPEPEGSLQDEDEDEDEDEPESDAGSSDPESVAAETTVSSKASKTVRDRLARDDAEISALEKKLGIKKKKAKKDDDGLEDLFGDLGDFDDDEEDLVALKPKRKLAEDEEWLRQKRRKVQVENDDFEGLSDSEAEDDQHSDDLDASDGMEDDISDAEEDFLEEESDRQPLTKRENPYVAPVTAAAPPVAAGKYIPPSLRKAAASEDEAVVRLNRRIQGLINRLSESNLLSIVQSVEALYQDNARQHVTSGIIDVFLSLFGEASSLSDVFIILHGGFIAALYRLLGTDFGAQLLERIVNLLDEPSGSTGNKPVNLISLLAIMYSLQVISCDIIYDLIRHCIKRFTEDDTELLLRVVKLCGSQLRQDDSTALKDVVSMVQARAADPDVGSLSVRQSFMIETISDLKNNRLKGAMASSADRAESLMRMKRLLGTVKAKSSKSSEPLRLSLDDIRSSDKKGKWWLVGASYHDPAKMADNDQPARPDSKSNTRTENGSKTGEDEVDFLELARQQGMNTGIRRAIFLAIVSAVDYKHAVIQVTKLNLKKAQLEEIPPVLVRCVLAENVFNPYYALVARELCRHRQVSKGFQFVLWDHFKRMDESEDGEEVAKEDRLDVDQLYRLARFYAKLLRSEALPITALKRLDFLNVQARTNMFLQVLLTDVMLDKAKSPGGSSREHILAAAFEAPDMVTGYQYFLRHVVAKSEIPEKKKDKRKVVEITGKVVQMLSQQQPSE